MDQARESNFYYASTPRPTPYAPLAGEQVFDACIVGGGISGLSAALHLAERGLRVALLEAKHLGYGGSGRSGGQSIFGYACEMSTLEQAVGTADARRLWDMAVEGMRLQRELIARHSIDCDYTPGHMILGLKPRHDANLREEIETLATRYDYHSLRLIGRDELHGIIASERYTSALHDSNGGHLQPYRYTLGLGRAAVQAGARIFEDSWVTRLEVAQHTGSDNKVHTAQGTVRARHLLVAGGALLGRLVPPLADKLIDIGTYIAVTQPLGE
jgi:gamma-glutamylputrescine oxidase